MTTICFPVATLFDTPTGCTDRTCVGGVLMTVPSRFYSCKRGNDLEFKH